MSKQKVILEIIKGGHKWVIEGDEAALRRLLDLVNENYSEAPKDGLGGIDWDKLTVRETHL